MVDRFMAIASDASSTLTLFQKLFENLFQDRLTSTQINKSIEKISKLISSERNTQKKLIKNDLYGIITGKNESFATLWERGNI